jgi:hypothetical protein
MTQMQSAEGNKVLETGFLKMIARINAIMQLKDRAILAATTRHPSPPVEPSNFQQYLSFSGFQNCS